MIISKPKLEVCPKCKKVTLEKKIFKSVNSNYSREMTKVLDKWNLNSIVEYICTNCDYRSS